MKRILVLAAWLAITPLAFAVETETFRSSAPAGALVRYSVTVSAAPGDDVDSIAAQLAATYGVKLEPADDGAPKRFALIASEARARLLSTDPRVAMVEDWSAPSRVAAASVPGLGAYAYDGAGNITQVGSRTYVYDSVGRLVSVSNNGSSEQQYTYDRYGNLLTITTTIASSSTTRLGVNPDTNRIDQNSTNGIPNNMVASYDAFGNITSSPTGSFKYDPFHVIKESTVGGVRSLYLYSASDERIATIQPSLSKELWTLRDSSARVLRRMDRTSGAWNWSQDYIYGAGRLIASAVPTEAKVLHYHLDHLGTPRLITGNGGAQIGQHDYYPFGLEIAGSTNDGERLKFTGHERDAATLDYMHARYYDGSMGRFLSVDPGRDWDPKQPQSWNVYTYVRNNPVNRLDPTGKCSAIVALTLLPLCGTLDLIDYGREKWTEVREGAFALTDKSAPPREKVMGGAIIGLVALEIGANAVEPADGAAIRGGTKLLSAAKTMDHHLLPQQFREFFAAATIDIDKFTVTLSESAHLRGVHGAGLGDMPGRWNKIWKEWIESNPNATAKEIYQQLGKMMDEFQLNNLEVHEYRDVQ